MPEGMQIESRCSLGLGEGRWYTKMAQSQGSRQNTVYKRHTCCIKMTHAAVSK
jgi:hypothetical protein